jgi:hypothetical protein
MSLTIKDVYTVKVVCEDRTDLMKTTIPEREQMLLARKVRRDRRSVTGELWEVEEIIQRAAILALLSVDTVWMDKHYKGKPYSITEIREISSGDLIYLETAIHFE